MPDSTRDEIARLEQEYENNPEGRIFVHLADAYRRAGELEKARGVLTEGLERHPDYLSARIVLAQVETELGESTRAVGVWREVVDLDPDNELALWALAELEYNDGNVGQSLGYYHRLADLGVDDSELHEMIGLLEGSVDDRGGKDLDATGDGPSGQFAQESSHADHHMAEGKESEGVVSGPGDEYGAAGPVPRGTGFAEALEDLDRSAEARSEPAEPVGPGASARGKESVQPARRVNGSTAIAHTDAIGLSDLLVRLLEYRDATFHAGSSLTRLTAVSIGRELDLENIHLEALALAALLSDLGGLGLGSNGSPLAELQDPNERREAEQREVAISLQLLHGITLPAGVHEAVRHQHERWDGNGYPDGLREEEIPYGARVIAVARAFADQLTRANEKGGISGAIEELQRNAGSRYDPVVVSVLRRVFQHRAEHGIGFGLGGRIIVVHPEELRALGVATQLHSEGYVAEVVRDAGGARSSVRGGNPKAVVVGAGIDKTEIARLIDDVRGSQEVSTIPLIVIDANDMDLRVNLLTAGADVCFASDVTFREFKATLDALLRRNEGGTTPDRSGRRIEARF